MDLKNKTIVITGASRGIGRALALKIASDTEGVVNLGVVARNSGELSSLKNELEKMGCKVSSFAGDVADDGHVESIFTILMRKYGRIDAVINNAGFGVFKQAADITAEEWSSVMDTNVKGTFLFSKYAVPHLKANGGGHIINIASDVAKRVFDGGSLYCASKYAQDAFSMALRKEVRPHKIKVSVIYSGLVDTHFHAHEQGAEKANNWLKEEDMANAILYVLKTPDHVVIDELMIHPMEQEY